MRQAITPAVPLLALLALSVTACGGSGGGGDSAQDAKPVAEVVLVPADGARDVKPDEPVTARVGHGTLTAVSVTGPDGKPAEGTVKNGAFTPKDGLAVDTADTTWFYGQAQVGDVFDVTGGKETVAAGNGFGEWNLSREDWRKLSALK